MRHIPTILKFLRSLLEPNPVLAREVKTRWRRPVVFLNLFLYAGLMALAMAAGYESEATRLNLIDGQQAADAGRRMFCVMLITQMMALMLIAPAISAPVIASERERGLLEALQLTELSARRLVWGKWLSVLGFLCIVVLISLPFATICFIFGGVSPAEFGLCLLVLTVSLLHLTALGLFLSSRSHRPATAWRDVFVCIVVWAVWTALYLNERRLFMDMPLWLWQLSHVVAMACPVSPISYWFEPGQPGAFDFPVATRGIPLTELQVLQFNLAIQSALTVIWFTLAVNRTSRPLKTPFWLDRREWIEKLRARWQVEEGARPATVKEKTQRALLLEFPLVARHSFNNPVFGRELRARTRLRAAPWWMWLLRAALLAYPVLLYRDLLSVAASGENVLDQWGQFTQGGLALLMLYAAVGGAGAFTREHESGTWENLKLSLIQPGEIVRGKVMALCCVAALLALPVALALLCCVRPNFHDLKFFKFALPVDATNLSLWHVTTALCIMAGAVSFAGCTAMLMSWFCRKTPIAIGLTILSLSILTAATFCTPGFDLTLEETNPYRSVSTIVNPVAALLTLTIPPPELEPKQRYAFGYKAPRYPWTYGKPIREQDRLRIKFEALLNDYIRRERAFQEQKYQEWLPGAERRRRAKLPVYRNSLRRSTLCPLTLFALGSAELLLICALMRQKFRDEK